MSDIHRGSEKPREGGSSSYSSVGRPLNDRPDLPCHASVSQLKTSHSLRSPSLSFISSRSSVSPLEDDQSWADRSEITP